MANHIDAEFAPWAAGMRRIGSMIAAQPVMQANAQARQRDAELMAARTQTEGAQARHYDASTAEIEQGIGGRGKLGAALRRLTSNPKDPEAVADAFEGAAQQMRHDPDGTMKAMGTVFGQLQAMNGDPALGANMADPVAMEKNRADNVVREKLGGEANATRIKLGEAANTSREKIASQRGLSTPEADSIRLRYLYAQLGKIDEEVRKNNSTEPGASVPRRKLRNEADALRKQILEIEQRGGMPTNNAAPAANQAQDPNDSEDATDPGGPEEQGEPPVVHGSNEAAPAAETVAPVASAPSFAEKVRVVHPDGRTGLIPKAQLQAAMAQGYKLAQ